ncbi:MAG: TetR/AcrR family transcriptional regulator [Pseudomonadota bacterium]
MGRRKSYDRDELTAYALDIFQEHGFGATSAEMLSRELGVNRYSLYAEFGNKQGLFEAALERYDKLNLSQILGPMERGESGVDAVVGLFELVERASMGSALGRGCLLCNTAVELGSTEPAGKDFIPAYFERIESAFATALTRAAERGELDQRIKIRVEAAHFTACLLGLFVMLRAKAPANVIQNATRSAAAHARAMRKDH